MARKVDRSPFAEIAAEGLLGDGGSKESSNKTDKPDNTPKNGEWIDTFLSAIMRGSNVTNATDAAGVHITLPYKRRLVDKAFRRAWDEAAEIGTELLEQEATRRAYHGTLKPVFYKGVECGYTREYSDTMMMFMLRARKPEKYRDGVHDGTQRGSIVLNVNILNVEGQTEIPLAIPQGDNGGAELMRLETVPSGDADGGE